MLEPQKKEIFREFFNTGKTFILQPVSRDTEMYQNMLLMNWWFGWKVVCNPNDYLECAYRINLA